jgi:hypothetical protein
MENMPEYVEAALEMGFEAEVDVWWVHGKYYLGHEEPTYEVGGSFFLDNELLWCHAKTPETLYHLLHLNTDCFYIEDMWQCTLTSNNLIWTSPNGILTPRSVAVMPEYAAWSKEQVRSCAGVCSDNLMEWM